MRIGSPVTKTDACLLDVIEPTVVPRDNLPEARQSMWDNRHTGSTYVVNHALPAPGLRTREAFLEHWAAQTTRKRNEEGQ